MFPIKPRWSWKEDEADKKGVQDGSDGLKIADPTMQPKTADHKDKHDQWEQFARRLIKEGVRVISQGSATDGRHAGSCILVHLLPGGQMKLGSPWEMQI